MQEKLEIEDDTSTSDDIETESIVSITSDFWSYISKRNWTQFVYERFSVGDEISIRKYLTSKISKDTKLSEVDSLKYVDDNLYFVGEVVCGKDWRSKDKVYQNKMMEFL